MTTLAAVALFAPPSRAHDLWIEPSSFTPRPGEPVALRLVLGAGAVGAVEAVPRANRAIVRFLAVGPGGEQPVLGLEGYDPAGFLRLSRPGAYTVVYESAPSLTTLDEATVLAYLQEEGLARPSAAPGFSAGDGGEPVHELFRRSLKALIQVDATGERGDARAEAGPIGLPLEIVLEAVATPATAAAESERDVVLRLLHDGAPLAGALVDLRALDCSASPAIATSVRTDAQGRARLRAGPGRWAATAVHLDAAHRALADWASLWASLSFELR